MWQLVLMRGVKIPIMYRERTPQRRLLRKHGLLPMTKQAHFEVVYEGEIGAFWSGL